MSALRLRLPLLGFVLFGAQPFRLDHVVLEDLDRIGHVADLVRRPRPGIATFKSPPASPVMADTIDASAFEIERPISSDRAETRTTESANAISIHVLTESRIAAWLASASL